jgi:hypothetical protein
VRAITCAGLDVNAVVFDDVTAKMVDQFADSEYRFDLVDVNKANFTILFPDRPYGCGWIAARDFKGDARENFWLRDSGNFAHYVNVTTLGSSNPWFFPKELGCSGKAELGIADGSSPWHIVEPRMSVADTNNDDFLDVAKTQVDTNLGLHRNTPNNGNNSLRVQVRGVDGDTEGPHTALKFYQEGTSKLLAHYQVIASIQNTQKHPHADLESHQGVDLEVIYPHRRTDIHTLTLTPTRKWLSTPMAT